MNNNYTPLDTKKIEGKINPLPSNKKGINLDAVLLVVGILLAVGLIFMLFFLIQKKIQSSQDANIVPTIAIPSIRPTTIPVVSESPVASPTAEITQVISIVPEATISATPTATVSVTPASTSSANLNSPTVTPSANQSP